MLPNIVMRKYFLFAAASSLFILAASAQRPQLTVDGKTNNGVKFQALRIEVKVCGTVARTTWEMVFKNTTSRVLEGDLNFPLKDGLSISRYAIDINGKMREAVPVDRSKGTEVFEAIERRRVDPGLLEKLDGNTFRTRIYPINPNSTRTVLIGYEEELPAGANPVLNYYLPLNLKDTVADFSLDVSIIQTASRPVFDPSYNENILFTKSNNQYTASVQKNNYVPDIPLSFNIPRPQDAAEVMLQEFEGKYCYLINTVVQKNERVKKLPASIGLFWDASFSGTIRKAEKELELLDLYFKKIQNLGVTLVVFSNTIKSTKAFPVKNGNWDDLKKFIGSIQYDGATDLGNLDLNNIKADEFILVSDGRHTLGNKQMQLTGKRVYCVNSSSIADYSNLKFIASRTGGLLIDLQKETAPGALRQLTTEPFRFLGVKQNDLLEENFPSIPVPVNDVFSVAGIAEEGIREIILQFGYGSQVTYEKVISINTETQLCEDFDISRVFAQKKIAELDIQYDRNRHEIERLGRQFGIVTRNTSLIVLETLSDYIQYKVYPPAELRAEYDRIMKQKQRDVITKNEEDLENSLDMIEELKEWYNPKPPKKEVTAKPVVQPTPRPVPVQSPRSQPVQPPVSQPANRLNTPTGGSRSITGKVTDIDGNPISFSTIKIKGTATGLSSDANGAYSLRVYPGAVLIVSGASFKDTEVPVGTQNVLNTVLEKGNTSELKEVVVTSAFGIRRSTRSTSSNIQNLSAEQINTIRQGNLNDALAGRVAGAQVRSQSAANLGAETTVRLRGENGFAADGGALYVVDGVIMRNGAGIKPDDVEDYTILPAPAAVALFGPEGANGAVLITTGNFKSDSSYQKIQEQVPGENKNIAAQPPFDIETYDYIKVLKQTAKAGRYLRYMELRPYYYSRPTYFFEVGSFLLKTGDRANALTILSNLAELENSSYELYKMLGYKLKEAGEYEGELSAFQKVMQLRPSDPQSYRDCALAYADLGKYQQALDMLYEGMTKSYSREMNNMYSGIEELFLTEINHLIALHKNKLNTKKIDKRLIAPMPSDIRVVMNWNMNNTDIDLWVTDPDGEKCYYDNSQTKMGGRISDDFTEGFGPEQFMLKKGIKGRYRIEIDYYSDTQVTLAGPTTIMAEIYLHYGTDKEERKIITLQIKKDKEGELFIGEVEL